MAKNVSLSHQKVLQNWENLILQIFKLKEMLGHFQTFLMNNIKKLERPIVDDIWSTLGFDLRFLLN